MKEIIKSETYLFALSFWIIFVTFEGSFSMMVLLPLVLLLLLNSLLKHQNIITFNNSTKLLFLFVLYLIFSTIINCIIHFDVVSSDVLIGVLYFLEIFFWYYYISKNQYNSKEFNLILKSYILSSLLCSILLIFRFISGQLGKIAMINFIGTEIDENYVSAFICIADLFLFYKILDTKTSLLKKIFMFLTYLIILFAIVISGSRAALIAILFGSFLSFLFSMFNNFNLKKIIFIFFVLLLLLFAGSKLIKFIPTWTLDRYFHSNYIDNSNTTRLLLWKNGIRGIIDSPVIGYGYGIFNKLSKYNIVNGISIPDRVPAHQTFIDIALYTGFIGIIIFLSFLFKIFQKYLKKDLRVFLPIIICFLFVINIIGAEKSVLLWNNLIIFSIIPNIINERSENYES